MILIHQALELAQDLSFIVAVISRETRKKIIVNLAVDIVDVGLLHPLANVVLVPAEGFHPAGMLCLHDRGVFLERLTEPFIHLRRQRNLSDQVRELLKQPLLPDVGFGAGRLEVAASIIDVLLLFDVADERASAMPAPDEAGEEEIPLIVAPPWLVATVKHGLHLIKEVNGDEGLMRALVPFFEPIELARINAGAQDLVDSRDRDGLAAPAIYHTSFSRLLAHLLQRVAAGCVSSPLAP